MPNFLCFSDSSLSAIDKYSSPRRSCTATASCDHNRYDKKSSAAAIGQSLDSHSNDADAWLREIGSPRPAVILFVRDRNKKSSFSLQRPYTLISENRNKKYQEECHGTISSEASVHAANNRTCTSAHEQERSNDSDMETAPSTTLVAMAVITSCSLSGNDDNQRSYSPETFLFGGFELISNVGTVEVYITREEICDNVSNSNNATSFEEYNGDSYLTTCKGVLAQDLPPLDATPLHVNGTVPATAFVATESINHSTDHDEKIPMEEQPFYKFIFWLPGGPKPMKRVQLKFVMINEPKGISGSIIVRSFEVKGRLKGQLSDSLHSQRKTTENGFHTNPGVNDSDKAGNAGARPNGKLSFDSTITTQHSSSHSQPRMPSEVPRTSGRPMSNGNGIPVHNLDDGEAGNMGSLSSIMAVMQEEGALDPHKLNVRKQSEILSKIPPFSLFIRNFEELTTSKNAKMLSGMEGRILDGIAESEKRIMDRLDEIAENERSIMNRLGAIEQRLKETDTDEAQHKSMKKQPSDEDLIVTKVGQ
mmetsp:Transcript_40593/g.85217  ORF Transcript_40593/g.85217 Transcript_40593/m.85217 type:complete len:533 (+) Transcript_40593:162-1760(+)|eukprot:CAMPEP_0183738902 /NCGR_PEP_ID=MMETSP0737-20130205/55729_1 /TAXON_ID=385413 /ORGANISM="Thalassiosira miniscula, Strain CCMP1093" /LENGTH=532 /DNA_ID=CAMNT_0025973551 /DNA_START=79 /DNA_END=1677 /DNA_ORIENTATION=+